MTKAYITLFNVLLVLAGVAVGCVTQERTPVFRGEYLGQAPPGMTAQIFAPGIVSTGMHTRDVAMTPDGNEIYYCVGIGNNAYNVIVFTKVVNGEWTKPEVASFSANPAWKTAEPFISPDGKKFYFASDRPKNGGEQRPGDYDIWVMDRTSDGWGEPHNLGGPVNSDAGEHFPSLTIDGTLYFTREGPNRTNAIYRSRPVDGKYAQPEKLPAQVNSTNQCFNTFIAPDESYIIVPTFGRTDSKGSTDYYVVFRNPDDTWSEPANMGDEINTRGGFEFSPYVSPDGKYFFFMSSRVNDDAFAPGEKMTYEKLEELYSKPGNGTSAIYWIDAKIIEELRPKPGK